MTSSHDATIENRLAFERKWIYEHGGNLTGYIARYGSVDDPKHYGDGGEAIYAADMAALAKAEAAVQRKSKGK